MDLMKIIFYANGMVSNGVNYNLLLVLAEGLMLRRLKISRY